MNPLAARLYRMAPVWAQNLALSGFGARLDRERYGGRFPEFRALLERSERYSAAELEAYQNERLRAIVGHAFATVPYYRERWSALGLAPDDIRTRDDLQKLPLLTKDDIRRHFDALRSTTVPARQLKRGHTSGTTGTPLTVGYDDDCVWMTYAVFDRHYRWAGASLGRDGDRIAVLRGNVVVPLDQTAPPFWRYNRHHHQMLLSSFHLSKQHLPAYVEALERFQPAVVDGYPSTLYIVAKFLESTGRVMPMRAAITSSETLYDFQREVIERQFACRVFDYYALAERVVFSGECDRHAGHHLAMEYGITEVVDGAGAQVAAGTVGRLVGTSLHNRAMPLIRYVTNDMSAVRAAACPCGRALQLMDDVTTKAEDVLTLPDGRMIPSSVLTHPFKPLEGIEGSQIYQPSPELVIVRIVPEPGFDRHLTTHLITELGARLGPAVQVRVDLVDRLEVSPNGKFKWVISKVAPPL